MPRKLNNFVVLTWMKNIEENKYSFLNYFVSFVVFCWGEMSIFKCLNKINLYGGM